MLLCKVSLFHESIGALEGVLSKAKETVVADMRTADSQKLMVRWDGWLRSDDVT